MPESLVSCQTAALSVRSNPGRDGKYQRVPYVRSPWSPNPPGYLIQEIVTKPPQQRSASGAATQSKKSVGVRILRRGDRAADGAALEMPCTVTRTEGSNPSLSAGGSSPSRIRARSGNRGDRVRSPRSWNGPGFRHQLRSSSCPTGETVGSARRIWVSGDPIDPAPDAAFRRRSGACRVLDLGLVKRGRMIEDLAACRPRSACLLESEGDDPTSHKERQGSGCRPH